MRSKEQKLSERIVSATAGALLVSLVSTPFDVVKIRLQAAQSFEACAVSDSMSTSSLRNLCSHCNTINFHNGLMEHRIERSKITMNLCAKHAYKGSIDAAYSIYRSEGFLALYNGILPTLWMAVPATVLYFAIYDELHDRIQLGPLATPLIAGSSARLIAATVISPLELVRTKIQATQNPPSMYRSFVNIFQTSGPFGFWRGLAPSLLRDVPFSAIYWVVVESVKKELAVEVYQKTPNMVEQGCISLTAGAVGGLVAAVGTHPFDVIKTRRQVFDFSEQPHKESSMRICRSILEKEGFRGLYVGLIPRLAKIVPGTAIMLGTYELGKHFFADQRKI